MIASASEARAQMRAELLDLTWRRDSLDEAIRRCPGLRGMAQRSGRDVHQLIRDIVTPSDALNPDVQMRLVLDLIGSDRIGVENRLKETPGLDPRSARRWIDAAIERTIDWLWELSESTGVHGLVLHQVFCGDAHEDPKKFIIHVRSRFAHSHAHDTGLAIRWLSDDSAQSDGTPLAWTSPTWKRSALSLTRSTEVEVNWPTKLEPARKFGQTLLLTLDEHANTRVEVFHSWQNDRSAVGVEVWWNHAEIRLFTNNGTDDETWAQRKII